MSLAPKTVPFDDSSGSGGPTPAPGTRRAPDYKPPAGSPAPSPPAAATPTLAPTPQGITVMNPDGSFISTDLSPRYQRYPGYSAPDDGMNAVMELLLIKALQNRSKPEKKREKPQIIVVQVPANSVPTNGSLGDPAQATSTTKTSK